MTTSARQVDPPGADPRNVAVVGAGHVGLVVAACLASVGHRVRAFDINEELVGRLQIGSVPFTEPNLGDLLIRARTTGSLSFHADPMDAVPPSSTVILCVDTPAGGRRPDISSLVGATATATDWAPDGALIINHSTAPVGTAEYLRSLIEKRRPGALSFAVNPEFLAEGRAIRDFLAPDRIVIGTWDLKTNDRVLEVYEPIISRSLPDGLPNEVYAAARTGPRRVPVVLAPPRTAEFIKYAANAYLAVKISFINELAGMADELGADITIVSHAIGLDRRIGASFLRAGLGWGGSCFPKDIAALQGMAEANRVPVRMLRAAKRVNREQRRWVVRKLHSRLGDLAGRGIALLGLAFKPQTDDLRSAPALDIAAELVEMGARVRAFDPAIGNLPAPFDSAVELAGDALDAARGMDAVVLATEWPEFAALDLRELASVLRNPLLIDGRNLFDPDEARAAGLFYIGIGRPGPEASAWTESRPFVSVKSLIEASAYARPPRDLASEPHSA